MEEVYFVAGEDIEDARNRLNYSQATASDTPGDAWNQLDLYDREERFNDFEVFEFVRSEKVTKVDPPYRSVPS